LSFEIFYNNRDSEQYLQYLVTQKEQFLCHSLEDMARKLYVVVPTNSLCQYLKEVCRKWDTGYGIQIVTLSQFANHIIHLHGQEPFKRSAVFSWVIRQAIEVIHNQTSNEDIFTYLINLERNEDDEDGYSALEESVRELFVAGFQPHMQESYIEALHSDSSGLSNSEAVEASLVIEVATIVYKIMDKQILDRSGGFGLQEAIYVQAERILSQNTTRLPSTRGVIVYGLHDATQVVTSFLERVHTVVGNEKCILFFHKVLDALQETSKQSPISDISNQIIDEFFEARFLSGSTIPNENKLPNSFSFSIQSFSESIGIQSELRNAFTAVYDLIQSGYSWKDCVIVARDLTPYIPYIRWEANRLGIPLSVESNLLITSPASRMLKGLIQLLALGKQCDILTLSSILEFEIRGQEYENLYTMHDLQAYCSKEGISTVQHVLQRLLISIGKGEYPLLNCSKIIEQDNNKTKTKAQYRILEQQFLETIHLRLTNIIAIIDQCYIHTDVFSLNQGIRGLVEQILRWPNDSEARVILEVTLDRLQERLNLSTITFKDYLMILGRELKQKGRLQLDHHGDGLRIFSAPDAIAMNFEHLFMIGLNREVFPQASKEDPLLDKRVRNSLKELLPGLPLRERKYLVERHLFHWIVSSAKKVHLSWQKINNKGSDVATSPLVRRLLWQQQFGEIDIVGIPTLYSYKHNINKLPIFDRIIVEGIHGTRIRYHKCLNTVINWATKDVPFEQWGISQKNLTNAICGSIDEIYPTITNNTGVDSLNRLGPYSGLTGIASFYPAFETDVFVTRFESVNSCPWKSFLLRTLRLPERTQSGPFPVINPSDAGSIVHNILEEIVCNHFPEDKSDLLLHILNRAPKDITWPTEEKLEQMIVSKVAEQLHSLGIHIPGVHEAMKNNAREFLEVVRETDFPNNVLPKCLGAEATGFSRLEISPSKGNQGNSYETNLTRKRPQGTVWNLDNGDDVVVQVKFKGDRFDIIEIDGEKILHLVDYKTGRPLSRAKRTETRQKDMLKSLYKGQKLQIPVYASCVQPSSNELPAKGSLFYLGKEVEQRIFGINQEELLTLNVSEDQTIIERLAEVIVVVLSARSIGLHFPRLVQSTNKSHTEEYLDENSFKANPMCGYCSVKEACHYGDSNYRRRLIMTAEQSNIRNDESVTMKKCHSIFQQLWRLGRING
jgi:RecB family exonuclease